MCLRVYKLLKTLKTFQVTLQHLVKVLNKLTKIVDIHFRLLLHLFTKTVDDRATD